MPVLAPYTNQRKCAQHGAHLLYLVANFVATIIRPVVNWQKWVIFVQPKKQTKWILNVVLPMPERRVIKLRKPTLPKKYGRGVRPGRKLPTCQTLLTGVPTKLTPNGLQLFARYAGLTQTICLTPNPCNMSNETTPHGEFVALVKHMRECQRAYFKTRNPGDLYASKQAEQAVDNAVAQHENPTIKPNTLF